MGLPWTGPSLERNWHQRMKPRLKETAVPPVDAADTAADSGSTTAMGSD